MKNKKLIKENAITLVALIITVIILIILAGVSLNLALGQNGIFQKSKEAVDKYQNATKAEKEQLDIAARDLMLGDYVQDGLMLHYDAVKNTKNGHDKNSNTWYDLSGNNNNGTLHEAIWTEDGLYFDGINDWVGIGQMNYKNVTLEVVVEFNKVDANERAVIGNWSQGGYGIANGNTKFNSFNVFTDKWNYVHSTKERQAEKKYSLSASYDNHEMVLYMNNNKTTNKVEGTIKEPEKDTIMVLGVDPEATEASICYFNRHNIFS